MVKGLLSLVVLAVAGLVAYNYATTGTIALVPQAVSSEDRALGDLAQSLEQAKQQYAQANRAAAVGGLDTTGDVEAAQASVRKIGADLTALEKRLKSPASVKHADELSRAVAEFARQLR